MNTYRSLTRRRFLGASATGASLLAAGRLFGEPAGAPDKPNPDLEKMAAVALAEAKKAGATYADIRINRYRQQFSGYRLSPERGGTKTDEVPFVTDQASFGFGVRVIAGGQWGFAASPLVSVEEIARIAREAVVVAKANAVLQASPVQLAPTRTYVDRWTSAFQKDPFGVSVEEKLDLIHGAAVKLRQDPKIMLAFGFLAFRAEDKYFASSEGSSIQQYIVQVFPLLQATAVDIQKNISRTRSYTTPPSTAGWEAIAKANLGENAPRIREEALEHLAAPPVTPGKKDLVLLPSHLWLTIHESIGHSTELDRALGYEANFAVTSFMTTVPLELEEAAKIDGCSVYRTFFQVVLPLLQPAVATLVILQAFGIWNDYLLASLYVSETRLKTLTVFLQQLFSSTSRDYNTAMAAIMISTVPIVVLFVFLQKYFIKGLAAGAVKG